MKILSSFTHPRAVPKFYHFPSSVENKKDILKKKKSLIYFSKYILCTVESKLYRFWTV